MTESNTAVGHTPGPLMVHVTATTRHGYDIQDAKGNLVAYNLKSQAYADLFAASPVMLEALKETVETVRRFDAGEIEPDQFIQFIRYRADEAQAAITLAEKGD